MSSPQRYEWIGDNVLATLSMNYTKSRHALIYSFRLTFEDYRINQIILKETAERDRTEGDANGWNTTVALVKHAENRRREILQLEENAKARGDRIISR